MCWKSLHIYGGVVSEQVKALSGLQVSLLKKNPHGIEWWRSYFTSLLTKQHRHYNSGNHAPHFWDWPLLTYLSEESWESRMFSHHIQNFLDFGIWKSYTKTVSLTIDSGSNLFFKAWGQSAVWSLTSVMAAQRRPTEVTPWLWSNMGILPLPATCSAPVCVGVDETASNCSQLSLVILICGVS